MIASLLLLLSAAAAGKCEWCVADDPKVRTEVLALARLKPAELINEMRKRTVCVRVMETRRLVPPGTFSWGSVERPTLQMREVSKLAGLMGKTLCQDELPAAAACPTIFLASDAPFSTLLHEYLHFLQIKRDKGWCEYSKELWNRAKNNQDVELLLRKEWDVHLFLWKNRERLPLALDDKIAIASEIVNEAEERKARDPETRRFLAKEKPAEYLAAAIKAYQEKMRIKK